MVWKLPGTGTTVRTTVDNPFLHNIMSRDKTDLEISFCHESG
jgi:hypothetical protein